MKQGMQEIEKEVILEKIDSPHCCRLLTIEKNLCILYFRNTEILKGVKMLVSVKKRYTLTLPKNIREELHIKEGEYMDAEVKNHSLVLTPVKVIKKDQEYFWTREWQEGEKDADEDIKRGKVSRAYGKREVDQFIKDLRKEAKKVASKKN